MADRGLFDGSVAVVQPIRDGLCDLLSSQNCCYNHIIRGAEGTERTYIDIISRCVKPYKDFESYLSLADNPDMRFIISNTTEAGIVFSENDKPSDTPPNTFPAKLTLLLKRRFDKSLNGFIILPCELIDRNGDNLKRCVLEYSKLWNFGKDFENWIEKENVFCNTLVDRINTGHSNDRSLCPEYEDKMLNTSEYFHLWVIESDVDIEKELPFTKAGLNVIVTKDGLERYRTRKVRILNGAHTSLVAHGLLSGFETVGDCMKDENMREHIRKCVYDEIIPTLDMPKDELITYAGSVLLRFDNPYINHKLAAISLNSVSKFKVRVLPSILKYRELYGTLPETLTFSLYRLIEHYKKGMANDDFETVEFIKNHTVSEILAEKRLWDADLSFFDSED